MLCGEDPICTFCNSKLKNEITHYIFDCSALKEERRTLMLKTGQLCASLPSIIDNMTQNKYIATAFYGFHKSISQKKANNMSKLFTSILRNRLNNRIEKRHYIGENQAGFRKDRSCLDHIFTLNTLIQLSLRKKRGKLYVFFVYLTKASDTVPREILWNILQKIGISSRFISIIKSYYEAAKISVRWKGEYSNNVKIDSGVLQGEPLSPLLFITYISDLIEYYNNSSLTGFYLPDFGFLHLLMYADDIAIIG
ncbi:hypothetical protein LAZ67_2004010 [Cordylochernes scorpioides]|uniref:Reverse transcriptase domain-containing protein n=1 Tax=Cordylochernes scorpioides TaxID=51811 RepID=A0ABY6K4B4_9ARAC|nr:hypothetical protein LAZ67_2004010 [Cordylochernes scorpioides]